MEKQELDELRRTGTVELDLDRVEFRRPPYLPQNLFRLRSVPRCRRGRLASIFRRLMLDTTIHSLVIARALLEQTEPLCMSDDRYLALAGLVVLQDALETVFYALLIERGVDEEKNLEKKSFDELIGELKAADVPIPKSGTLKALNKQRILTKHYAQVAEPVTVRTYFEAAGIAIDAATTKVLARTLRNLFIADLLKDGEARRTSPLYLVGIEASG